GEGPPGEKQGLVREGAPPCVVGIILDLTREKTYTAAVSCSFTSLHIHGGVTVSTGMREAA
ncbi:MAG: hypothetical protein KJ936_04385, partial [Proteobacteria bacterium]|nr:hypothetical protein [Pseudomonadota bacterium]